EVTLLDLTFIVTDTAGLEDAPAGSLEARMQEQTEKAVAEADMVLFLIDARAGVTALDRHFAQLLRRARPPVVLAANKCEGPAAEAALGEAYALGLGQAIPLSAEHALGLSDLRDAIAAHMGEGEESGDETPEDVDEAVDAPLRLAIVGRPNVGKSTLVNRLLGEERVLTGPEAGITRDAIEVEWAYEGRPIRLIDTAGLRRRARATEKLERLSAQDTRHAIDFAEVVVLVIEAETGLEKQDLTIARQVIEEGRALLIAVNKWDACKDRPAAQAAIGDRLMRSLPQTGGIPVVPISALRGQHLDRLMAAIFELHKVWDRRISTAALNRWLAAALHAHPPPAPAGRRLKLRYATQAKARPPTFVIFCSRPKAVPASYLRYLENSLRSGFDLPGTPIRILLRKGENPFVRD
ncbi:MAG TPA: ribosome biogenesis GTPase Der, partial [Paracoccaceae bacterium]